MEIDSAGTEKMDHQEIIKDHRGDQSGDPVTTGRQPGEVTNRRETSKGRRTRANNGICTKPPHYALPATTGLANTSLVT
jgi:hypothetical protein